MIIRASQEWGNSNTYYKKKYLIQDLQKHFASLLLKMQLRSSRTAASSLLLQTEE